MLQRCGMLDDGWIIYTSDHGEMTGEHRLLHKRVLYDPAVKVPLVLRPPRGCPARTVAALVEHFDLSATIREIAGGPDLPGSAATSLLPMLRGDADAPLREVATSEACGFAMFRDPAPQTRGLRGRPRAGPAVRSAGRPAEDRNLVLERAGAGLVEDLMARHVRPFLARRPLRPHRTLVERQGAVVAGA